MKKDLRCEIKIPFNQAFDSAFLNWRDNLRFLKKVYADRIVNSIYYDTPEFDTAQDNLYGISSRKKYRIRWYNKEKYLNYEIKFKKNNLGSKIIFSSKNINTNFESLFSFRNLSMLGKNNFIEYVTNFNLEPKLKVSYNRSYYLLNNRIRITFDRNIKYESPKLAKTQKKLIDTMNVVEIKYDLKDLNLASEIIQNSNFVPKRFSKYLRGLSLIGNSVYI